MSLGLASSNTPFAATLHSSEGIGVTRAPGFGLLLERGHVTKFLVYTAISAVLVLGLVVKVVSFVGFRFISLWNSLGIFAAVMVAALPLRLTLVPSGLQSLTHLDGLLIGLMVLMAVASLLRLGQEVRLSNRNQSS